MPGNFPRRTSAPPELKSRIRRFGPSSHHTTPPDSDRSPHPAIEASSPGNGDAFQPTGGDPGALGAPKRAPEFPDSENAREAYGKPKNKPAGVERIIGPRGGPVK